MLTNLQHLETISLASKDISNVYRALGDEALALTSEDAARTKADLEAIKDLKTEQLKMNTDFYNSKIDTLIDVIEEHSTALLGHSDDPLIQKMQEIRRQRIVEKGSKGNTYGPINYVHIPEDTHTAKGLVLRDLHARVVDLENVIDNDRKVIEKQRETIQDYEPKLVRFEEHVEYLQKTMGRKHKREMKIKDEKVRGLCETIDMLMQEKYGSPQIGCKRKTLHKDLPSTPTEEKGKEKEAPPSGLLEAAVEEDKDKEEEKARADTIRDVSNKSKEVSDKVSDNSGDTEFQEAKEVLEAIVEEGEDGEGDVVNFYMQACDQA